MEHVEGSDFAGVWFDPVAGEFVIPHVRDVSASLVENAAEDASLDEQEFRTPLVASTWADLEEAQEMLNARLDRPDLENLVLTYLEPETNSVGVLVASDTTESQEQDIREQMAVIGSGTELKKWPAPELRVADTYCRPLASFRICNRPLRGGVAIQPMSAEGSTCTAGFKAVGNLYGNRFLLTAGHCVHNIGQHFGSYDPVSAELKEIGAVEGAQESSGDWAKIKANGSWWDVEHWPVWVAKWGNDEEWEIQAESASYKGEFVCHSGFVSDGCGEVIYENVYGEAENGIHEHLAMFGPTCAEPGDSGGPVHDNHVALGIMSGRVEPAGECGQQYGLFSEITEADDAMGVHVGPRLGAPPYAETVQSYCCSSPHHALLSGEVGPHALSTEYAFEYGLSESYGQISAFQSAGTGWGRFPVSGEVSELRGNSVYHYRIRAQNAAGITYGYEYEFTTPDWHPLATTEAATNVKAHSATLHGSVNPLGEPTEYQFEYGTTTSYGTTVPVPPGNAGSGIVSSPVQYALSGLEEATVYHYRLRATNQEGTSYGADREFRTPGKPVLVTPPTTRYTNTFEPQLTGLIIPNGAATTHQFEYGTTTAYGTKVPSTPASIGASLEQISVGQYLSGLQPGTTYHFRLVAENEVGRTTSADQTFTTLPPCKGAEGKCAWSAQATIDPPPFTEDELKGVSCASATLCMAIGLNHYQAKSLIERWNGSSWSLVQSIGGELKGISCPATTACVAVGVDSGGAARSWMLSELNGSWGVTSEPVPPLPVGATETTLNAVSCVTTVCTAVGSYRNSEGTYRPLVERWNGSAWGIQVAPSPSEGSAQKAMLGISCPGTTFCLTVGEAANKPFAERYSSTEGWKVIAAPKPSGAAGAKLASVSCATSTVCMAAGDSYEGIGTEKTLAERWDGTSLTITSSPNPAGAQGWVNFTGVSCPSTTACTAVGYYASKVEGVPSELKTLAESWNGSAWSLQSPTNPAASTHSVLEGVSCYSTTGCIAVGLAEPGPTGETEVTLAEGWNGTTWSTQATVNPAPLTEDELKDVACMQAGGACFAVGRNVYRQNSFIELWNGTGWQFLQNTPGEIKRISCEPLSAFCTAVGKSASGAPQSWMISEYKGSWIVLENTAPVPAGGTATTLNGVSCTSTACTAVGNYLNSEGTYRPLVERWNGSAWLLQEAPNPPGGGVQNAMLAVSCSTSTSCMAVGEVAGKPVAETWNGSSWSVVSVPLPAGATAGKLTSVACPALGACFAAGYSYEKVGAEKALVESWNGTTWSVTAVPNPADAQGYVNLASISCLSPRACVAAGAYAPSVSGGAPASLKPMVESLTGTQWSLQTPAPVAGFGFAGFSGISCVTVIACNAVGTKSTALQGQPALTLAERYG